jgi:hypothetical protein
MGSERVSGKPSVVAGYERLDAAARRVRLVADGGGLENR